MEIEKPILVSGYCRKIIGQLEAIDSICYNQPDLTDELLDCLKEFHERLKNILQMEIV